MDLFEDFLKHVFIIAVFNCIDKVSLSAKIITINL